MVSFCATIYKVDLQFLECCNVVLNGILILSGAVHFSYSDQLFILYGITSSGGMRIKVS